MQFNIFHRQNREALFIRENGVDLVFYEEFIPDKLASYYFNEIYKKTNWHKGVIWIYDKLYETPRLSAWYGNFDNDLEYFLEKMPVCPWNSVLQTLKSQLAFQLDLDFNAVFLNLYRNEDDSVAWHSDKERIAGKNPTIVLLSLGAERRFELRHRYNKSLKKIKFQLKNGSVLIMRGTSQRYWQHCLPKLSYPVNPRMSLTFRKITLNSSNK